jgi:hypothetical protein
MSLSLITSDLGNVFGRMPTIFYHAGELHEESTKQPSVALVTVISDIALVEEEKLSWEQVLEFRRDKSARRKYRRFIRWWSHAIDSATPSQLHDDIAAKLDDYEWSLKKHGLVAATGALSCILDPKFVAGVSVAATAASMLGGGLWAALASSGLTIGRATVSISTALIEGADERHRTNGEVAYLHEVQKRLGTAS